MHMTWQMMTAVLQSNEQLRTETDRNTEKGCQKPAVQQKTTDDGVVVILATMGLQQQRRRYSFRQPCCRQETQLSLSNHATQLRSMQYYMVDPMKARPSPYVLLHRIRSFYVKSMQA